MLADHMLLFLCTCFASSMIYFAKICKNFKKLALSYYNITYIIFH